MRKLVGSVFVAGAAAAIAAGPTAALLADAPSTLTDLTGTNQVILATPSGHGDAGADDVQGSPHFFLADGSDVHNPGIELHWEGEPGSGFPVVDTDDPSAIDELVRRAAN